MYNGSIVVTTTTTTATCFSSSIERGACIYYSISMNDLDVQNFGFACEQFRKTCLACYLITHQHAIVVIYWRCARVRAPWNSNYYTLDIFVLCTLLAVIVVEQMHSIYIWNCACITSMRWNCINSLAACYFVREFMCSCVSQITNWNLMHGTLHRAALTNFIFSQI